MDNIFDGKKLFMARHEKKISRKKLGEKIGVATSAIQAYENGKSQPKLGRINELANAVDIDPKELLKLYGTKITKVKKNIGNIMGDNSTINNNQCNHELEEIEKEILEECIADCDANTVFKILRIIKKHKK